MAARPVARSSDLARAARVPGSGDIVAADGLPKRFGDTTVLAGLGLWVVRDSDRPARAERPQQDPVVRVLATITC
jgi:hypothetical protein